MTFSLRVARDRECRVAREQALSSLPCNRFEQSPDPKPGENEVIAHVRAAALKPVARYGRIAGPVDPLWSISVEEQFYILIPLIIATGRRAVLAIASGVFLFTVYAAFWLYAHHASIGDNGAWTNSFVQFQFFAAGTLIALALHGRLPRFPIHLRIICVALAICCWFSHSFHSVFPSAPPLTYTFKLIGS